MKTLKRINQLLLLVGLLLLNSNLDAQVRTATKRVVAPTQRITANPQNPANPEPQNSALLYQPMPKRVLDLPIGEDGADDHADEVRANRVQAAQPALRSRVALPNTSMVWNNIAFASSNPTIVSEAPSAMYSVSARAGNNYCSAPIIDASLAPVYASAKAYMPFYFPYRNKKVTVWQGFYYNNGGFHGSIDYGKSGISSGEDPGFPVYAVAAGKVIDVGWTNGGGNFITIEHTASNGHKYRSKYIHLRNGNVNDRNKTKAIPSKNADYIKVKKYAQKNNNPLSWGKSYHTLKVKKGDVVKSGQFIAYAGNTGVGGIKIALKSNGDFTNSNTRSYNVHLHFSIYIKDTRPGKSGWVKVDPYGAYTKDSGNTCYNLGSNTAYNRLFAPFYPSFHNVPLDLVNTYFGYYTGMGMSLQTLAVTRNNSGKLMAVGSFQEGLSKSWYARFYMTANSFQKYFNEYKAKGFRPRQINTSQDSKGKLRYSVIWEKNPSGEAYYAFFGRSDSNFSTLWNTYIKSKKYHLAEHNTFNVNGKRYHAGVFVKSKSSNAFYAYYGMSSSSFNKKFKDLSKKWQITSIHVNGSKIGGVWRPVKKGYYAFYGMSPATYQSKFSYYSNRGYRLYKVQNYAKNTKYAAIWVKN